MTDDKIAEWLRAQIQQAAATVASWPAWKRSGNTLTAEASGERN